ncbi:aldehyde dehydrogenase family protein [Advenella mimigardefordensis]|uniref:Betaine aldehyde dehydrogenase n=1 Tax=Advenella mimigardefordensis (strain DSM 17166 / LMG 22922 / DPN7) TaxID=1247726 RepID=W0PGE9_ADVMD|nr:aldehyde dehydrogenase family protein [Advenella mimigardefordensis]AHG64178.1 betaine aldehyde dehydrogenase [Advenella mimigardefordensis DPN7]
MNQFKTIPAATGRMLIEGQLSESLGGKWITCISPSTGADIGKVPDGTTGDVERAVSAAQSAQTNWAALSVAQRAHYLLKLADALAASTDELLAIEVASTGNSITGMKGDISSCIERLRYFAGLGYELQGNTIPESSNKLNLTLREPYGVVGRIVAFNHPLAMAVHGIASPLVAGNTVILKPSEQCPLSATLLGEIASKVLPAGVLSIVTGGAEVGNAIVRHPQVKRLSFVGSVRTGLAIQRAAAEVAVKSISLELGGKNPFIVFPDAPIEQVAKAAVLGMNFIWQGQSCSSTSRLFVHDSIYDEVVQHVTEHVRAIRIGDPFEDDTQMGAIVSQAHLASIENYVRIGQDEGARLVAGGKRPTGTGFEKGNWFEPTVFSEVRQDMRVAREEIFGPILSILRWSDTDEVIDMANSVEYGLTAAVWTSDITKAITTAKRLQSGYIWINGVNTHVRSVPFGGYKNSGTGRERGIEELYSYTEEKSIQITL